MQPHEIAIAVMSCTQHRDTRQAACRDTWFKDAARLKVKTFFVEGRLDSTKLLSWKIHDHTQEWASKFLYVPAYDGYYDLRHKVKLLMEWFSDRQLCLRLDHPHFLYKCDDDTFVHVERLLALDPGRFEYIGCRINEGFAAGGAGYIVSRRVAGYIADMMRPKNVVQYSHGHWGNHEDLAIGQICKNMGIELWDNRRFNRGNAGVPTRDNDSISGHHIQPEYMRQLWNALYMPEVCGELPPSPFLPVSA